MPMIPTNDINLYVEDSGGAGRAVVLIHGWPLSGASWAAQVPALTQAGYRVIAYDRRGFGKSDKPAEGFDYDTLSDDLSGLMDYLDLHDATLVGFSMGGGEVARYISRYGEDRLHSVVFAAAVPPFMMKSEGNPDGPLTEAAAKDMEAGLRADRTSFFDTFTKGFFSVDGVLKVSEDDRQQAIKLSHQSDQVAALGCMKAFATTDFREDLSEVTVPTLVIHGAGDATVPFEGSGARTHYAIDGSDLVVIEDAPHGFNTSHADEFNEALIAFLKT